MKKIVTIPTGGSNRDLYPTSTSDEIERERERRGREREREGEGRRESGVCKIDVKCNIAS